MGEVKVKKTRKERKDIRAQKIKDYSLQIIDSVITEFGLTEDFEKSLISGDNKVNELISNNYSDKVLIIISAKKVVDLINDKFGEI